MPRLLPQISTKSRLEIVGFGLPLQAENASLTLMSYSRSPLRTLIALPLCGVATGALSLFASTDYEPAIYRPMSGCSKWYTSGNGHHFCIIHDMEGYYWTTISYLNRCDKNSSGSYNVATSIHYMINGQQNGSDEDGHNENNSSDPAAGEITQSVREAYYAWHARCWNTWMWGTEHEGFASSPAWYTEPMYLASSGLQRHLMQQTTHPIDRNHIIGHNEWKTTAWKTWMAANYPSIDSSCNTHSDPGAYWNWSHFMSLVTGGPAAPTSLNAAPLTATQIKLTWTDNATNESGFKIERSTSATGTFTQIGTNAANVTSYTNSGLTASTPYYYRVRSYNVNGNSDYSNVRGATTGNSAPVLTAIGSKTVMEGTPLTFTAKATDSTLGQSNLISNFESYAAGTANVMFQKPGYSGSTSSLIDTAATNYTSVVTSPAGHSGTRVLQSTWTFNSSANPWVRLTTIATSGNPNPVVDLRQIISFDIYTDKTIKLAIGLRETTNAAGTAIGSDGGTLGGIEWVGVTNVSGSAPMPSRTINAGSWQTVRFNLPFESIRSFASGNGVLSTASGLGTLEHLAIVPAAGLGPYTVYLDNFSVVYSNVFNFTMDAGAPTNASLNLWTGAFAWTPTEAQGPGIYDVTVRVTDLGTPALDDYETITVSVLESNLPPTLSAISSKTVYAGDTLSFTNTATDADLPANELTFSLDPGAPADALVETNTGVFSWTPPIDFPTSTNLITMRVTDDSSPQFSNTKTFSVKVISRIVSAGLSPQDGNVSLSWATEVGKKYRVQYKVSLSDPDWTDLTTDIVGNGSIYQHNDSLSTSQRYYRIIQVP